MSKATIAGLAFAAVLVLAAVVAGYRVFSPRVQPAAVTSPAMTPSTSSLSAATYQGFIYGRITTVDGATHEGRLRWGSGGQEAFWGDYFNGAKHENPWLTHLPEELRKERHPVEVFGIRIADKVSAVEVRRQLTAPFGEVARIEANGFKLVRVTLKSGTVYDLDRFEASDFDDDVRVWDDTGRAVDLDSRHIRSIELLPTPALGAVPPRLQGTVRTKQGDFTGFIAWDRDESVGTDELDGRTPEAPLSLRFDTIRSVARRPTDVLVTLVDGRELVLKEAGEAGPRNRGTYVDDPRYGRVLISWDAFERVDFGAGASGPAYGEFPPGAPLAGRIETRDGRHLAGRLVYDLDESETTETLDASFQDVDYTIPFGMVASIVAPVPDEGTPALARVTLINGEEVKLESNGDVGDRNAGMLVFVDGGEHPEYVPWANVARIEFDHGGRELVDFGHAAGLEPIEETPVSVSASRLGRVRQLRTVRFLVSDWKHLASGRGVNKLAATVVFPFFILQPSLGLGVAASKTAHPTQARLKSLVTHTVFGIGLYACALGVRYVLPPAAPSTIWGTP